MGIIQEMEEAWFMYHLVSVTFSLCVVIYCVSRFKIFTLMRTWRRSRTLVLRSGHDSTLTDIMRSDMELHQEFIYWYKIKIHPKTKS